MKIKERWQQASTRQRVLTVLASVYVLYALLGYFVLSPIARDQIVAVVSEETGRDVTLERFTFNPLGLAITAENFALKDPDGEDFVAFDEFYADFELSSLFRLSWHFDDITLVRPRIRVTQEQNESLNFDDIIQRIQDQDSIAEEEIAKKAEEAGIPSISIGEFHLIRGNFVFRDEARTTPDEIAFNDLSFDIVDFSTHSRGEEKNSYTFEVMGPEGGHFLWAGKLNFDPLIAEGKLALEGLRLEPLAEFAKERLNFSIPDGELDIRTSYRYESADDVILSLSDGVIQLRDVRIDDRRTEAQVIAVPDLMFTGITLDTVSESVGVGEVRLTKPNIVMRMTQDGLDLETLFTLLDPPPSQVEKSGKTDAMTTADETSVSPQEESVAAKSAEESSSEWDVMVNSVVLDQANITYRDETLKTPASVALAPLSMTLKNISPNKDRTFTFDGNVVVADQGDVKISGDGELVPFRVSSSVSISQLALGIAEPWLRESIAIDLRSGLLDSDLKIDAHEQGDDFPVTLSGSSRVQAFDMTENGGSPIVAFKTLQLDGINVDTSAYTVQLEGISFDALSLTAITDEQGGATADRIAVPAAAADASAPSTDAEQEWRVLIGTLALNNATVDTLNKAMSPNFRMGIYQLSGTLSNLDSSSKKSATLNLTGKVDKYAPFTAKGTLNPLAAKPQADVVVTLQGYEMTSLTPFTGEYLGYAVSSGQLGFKTEAILDDTYLDCRNQINAANFFLGEKVESEDALKVPIKLGLAVLRNRSGVITLPVEAKGDLSDPNVSARGIILKALGNVLVKAATSPFSMLAGLAGGADLSSIPFEAGSYVIDAQGRESLSQLIAVMEERPHLEISLAGSVVPNDRVALATSMLGKVVQGEDWNGLDSALQDKTVRRAILRQYKELKSESADALMPVLADGATAEQKSAAEIEQAQRAWDIVLREKTEQVSADQLQELAALRAQNTKTVLVEELKLDASRLFIANTVVAGDQVTQGVVLGLAGK